MKKNEDKTVKFFIENRLKKEFKYYFIVFVDRYWKTKTRGIVEDYEVISGYFPITTFQCIKKYGNDKLIYYEPYKIELQKNNKLKVIAKIKIERNTDE